MNAHRQDGLLFRVVLGAGGHVGSEDVVGVAVGGFAVPVVAQGAAGVGVAARDLDVA
jgi:hypothetical protein